MPSVIIDKKITYSRFGGLYRKLNNASAIKRARSSCSHQNYTTTDIKNFCHEYYKDYDNFSMIYWDDLLDFTFIRNHIRVINRGHDFNLETLKNLFGKNIYYFKETKRYGFQYFDMINTTRSLGNKFDDKFFISEFQSRNEKLLHFGSLHGSSRIILDDNKNKDFLNKVKKNLKFNHPKLILCIKRIIKELGGLKNYIGVHIRTGETTIDDKMFRDIFNNTTDTIFEQVNYYFLNGKFDNMKCLESKRPVIYLATDAKNPRQTFRNFYSTFEPCIFSMSNFEHHLNIINNLTTTYDNYNLKNFFIPLVDLLVISGGGYFVGTNLSTFSKVAKEIHTFQIT
ncbi:3467_t:CDS:1 [Scutellospora calospora]|uniref:3467_t:CDS:1 n=1 Tax=Scutellospora calospora TaxID=85575 RepID=A0ACA9K1S0_9GLOM|nr:3467_t:CDS:1 [Scutellospora calospora]